jgi:hypothetical protein
VSRSTKLQIWSFRMLQIGSAGAGNPLISYSHISSCLKPGLLILTVESQMQEHNNTNFQAENVQNKLPQVIDTHAVINPGAVTIRILILVSCYGGLGEVLLIMLCNAPRAAPAMFTT